MAVINWFWNSRGDCVDIRNEQAIRSALNNGFIPLSQEECLKFKPGDYHPGHDMGDGSTVHTSQPQNNPPPFSPVQELRIIEI